MARGSLVDSSVWIDFFNGLETRETDALDNFLGQEPVLIGDLTEQLGADGCDEICVAICVRGTIAHNNYSMRRNR